ncbi:MAG: DUF2203 domain-containing protein [Candidatus Dormibacteraeota bacterium]|nr:DUF2203 domain-containing protein [Candidatus Dormibacteraeota bacterium]
MERTFSVAEANALLPELVDLVTRLQAAHNEFRGATHVARQRASSNGSLPDAISESGSEYMRLLAQINQLGVIVRDPETGLCDLPSVRDGEDVFLCWRLGEERVAFWHPPDTGAAGRQPI